jgi:hypothetical protein
MIDLNIGNILTISIIGVASYAALKFGLKAAGVDTSWM